MGLGARLRDMIIGQETIILPPSTSLAKSVSYETINPSPLITVTSTGQEVTINLGDLLGADPAAMFRTQPYLRSVVSFLARNIAQLGVHVFRKMDEVTRIRDTTCITAQLIRSPNDYTTRYELLNALVSDLALWDQAFWLLTEDTKRESGWRLTPIPVTWVESPFGGDVWEPDVWNVTRPGAPTFQVAAKNMIHFHGWDPNYLLQGISPVDTLKSILLEQLAAVVYRSQRWERGGRVGHIISRPAGAPQWSNEAEERFRREWRNAYSGRDGVDAGGTPILQDGMTMTKVGFSAVEDEFVDAAKLALTTVASVYHVNPTMIGLLDNANYSNVREFRRMLYGDTLGPWLSQIEDRINGFLIPRVEPNAADLYAEFNIAEKLQGSFEEQATVASMAVGGPYMTRNEYRLRQNLPPIDGADELIVPMNVTQGGQPSPVTPLAQVPLRMAGRPGTKTGTPEGKAKASDRQVKRATAVLKKFYARQARVVLSALGSKSADDWWDEERWDGELADDLYTLAMRVSGEIGSQVNGHLGAPDPYDPDLTADYLRAVMTTRAQSINATTKDQIDAALADDSEDAPTPADVFTEAVDTRADTGALTIMTTVAGIATSEAAKQAAGPDGGATKTWVVNSANSRHPEMDGETVDVDSVFSNGAAWPGDSVLGPDETAGCQCELVVNIP